MFKFLFWFLLPIAMIFLCFAFALITIPSYGISKNERLMLTVEKQAAKTISAQHQMRCVGSGGGFKDDKVRMSALSFRIPRPINEQEARRLIVAITQEYLHIINKNKELRPALLHYPFTNNDVELSISSTFPNGSDVYHPNIGIVFSLNGKIYYSTNDPDDKFKYKLEEEESFDDALRILALENILQPRL